MANTLVMGYLAIAIPSISMYISSLFAGVYPGVEVLSIPTVITILGFGAPLPLQIAMGIYVIRRGLDPDIYLYPWSSNVSDIIISVLIVTASILSTGFGVIHVVGLLGLYTLIVMALLLRSSRDELFKSMRESLVAILGAALLTFIGGIYLSTIHEYLALHPSIYIIIPPLLSLLGSYVSTLGSIYTTMLRKYGDMGLSTFKDLASKLMVSSAIVSAMVSAPSYIASMDPMMLIISLIGYTSAALLLSPVAYIIAKTSLIRGWDPDNLVIPLSTSLSDLVLTLLLGFIIAALL